MIDGIFRGAYHTKKGLIIISREPDGLKINPTILTKIFSNHLKKRGLSESRLTLEEEGKILISYFSGIPHLLMTTIIVDKKEDWNQYISVFNQISKIDIIESDLKYISEKLVELKKFDENQTLYLFLSNHLRRRVLLIMRNNGIILNEQLGNMLIKEGFPSEEIIPIINDLIEKQILFNKIIDDKNYLILTKDYLIYRSTPPKEILEKASKYLSKQVLIDYLSEIDNFFEIYNETFPNEMDEEVILNLINDTLLYHILSLLRRDIIKEEELFLDIEAILLPEKIESLKSAGFVKEVDYQDNKCLVLKSDPKIKEIFPLYVIKQISDDIKDEKTIEDIIKNLKSFTGNKISNKLKGSN